MEIDRFDRQILQSLQDDGRISNQDLADRIGLSASPCLRRVRALEEAKIITGYRALLNAKALGYTLMALIYISIAAMYYFGGRQVLVVGNANLGDVVVFSNLLVTAIVLSNGTIGDPPPLRTR